ncbi:MAG: hypothetical protein ABSD89_10345 [Halobacteriota archaeon]
MYAGLASALRINRRIENDEIPLFVQRCVIDATRWEVGGTQYEQWRAENGNGKDPAVKWRDEVVTPYLQQRFDGLELRGDGNLCDIRHDTDEEIDERFYDTQQLGGSSSQSVRDNDGCSLSGAAEDTDRSRVRASFDG